MVPFCNFQDTSSAKVLYGLFLQKDSDADVLEFISNDMLNMASLFEDEDDEAADQCQQPPAQHPQTPFQPIQISPGFLYCVQTLQFEQKEQPVTPRVFGSFINDTYRLELSSSIFHPPVVC